MSRWEFMMKLEELLADISPGEREEALKYYNDYINDAGKENEANVLNSLGTPAQVAANIKAGLDGNTGEFTESGFHNQAEHNDNPVTRYQKPTAYNNQRNTYTRPNNGMSGLTVALIIILCIFASPLILGIGIPILGLVISLFGVLLIFILVFGILAIVLLPVSVIIIFAGLIRLFTGPLTGLGMISAGLIMGGLGFIFLLLTVLFLIKVIPAIFKGIISMLESIFRGKRGARNA